MTAIVACCSVLLVWVSTSFVVDLADVAARRARAQTAADAAALAAISASLPGGSGSHVALAREYAAANGARLRACNCAAGATSVEVDVEVAGVEARARAVIDTRLLGPVGIGAAEGLDPAMQAAVDRLIAAGRGAVRVVSGKRSSAEQARLWTAALRRHGSAAAARRWVAPPGRSMHERGRAVDLAGDLELAARLVRDLHLPLHRPLDHEPWHFELLPLSGAEPAS